MDMISTTEARAHFSELINRVSFGKERIQLERQGKPLAVIMSLEDLKLFEELEDRFDIIEAEKGEKEVQKKGTKPLRQLMKELNL